MVKRAIFTLGLSLLIGTASFAASNPAGNLSGLLLDEAGKPLSDVVVSLLKISASDTLPTMARSNALGRVFMQGLESGKYQVNVKSARYRSPVGRTVEILPERTSVVTLILQQVFGIEEGFGENLGVKALLRGSEAQRLIFRQNPGYGIPESEASKRFFEEAVFEIYTNAGLGDNYFVFPGDPWGGTSTNFAVVDSLGVNSEYIFAGQLNSGEDSIWRLRNVVDYDLGENHSIQLFLGYGRMSFEQPSMALLDNPVNLKDDTGYASAVGSAQLLNLGFENKLTFGPALSFTWGLEVDRLRGAENAVFVSPSSKVEVRPFEKTSVTVSLSSKRPNLGNSVALPDGGRVELASPLYIARIGHDWRYGTARHYEASVTQYVRDGSELEFALFRNTLFGGALPLVAVYELDSSADLLQLQDGQAVNEGYRVTFREAFSTNLSAEVSYLRGRAPSLPDSGAYAGNVREIYEIVDQKTFNAIIAQLDAYVPHTRTQVTTLLKVVPDGQPLTTLDVMSDVYETGNEGVNLFIRQDVPLPAAILGFLGLEFLTPERIEALLDVRNLLNDDLGAVQTAMGDIRIVQNPRSVRGGLSFRF